MLKFIPIFRVLQCCVNTTYYKEKKREQKREQKGERNIKFKREKNKRRTQAKRDEEPRQQDKIETTAYL